MARFSIRFIKTIMSGDWVFVLVDCFSSYFDIAVMEKVTSVKKIACFEKMFASHGIPISITCDNRPQFKSLEFKEYLRVSGIKLHNVPSWPQANVKSNDKNALS